MRNFLFAFAVLALFSFYRWRTKWSREAAAMKASGGSVGGGRVAVDDAGIAMDVGGETRRIAWSQVQRVHIESVAGGLNADEVLWVLTPERGATPMRVPQTAPGADLMIARLQQLPGFRYEPMIQSMITTDATQFLVWER